MTTIALTGSSRAIAALRHGLTDSPLPFELVDDARSADLVVTDEPAPTPNHLGVAAVSAPDTFYCRDESVGYILAALTEAHLIDAFGVRVRPPVQDGAPLTQQRRWWRRSADPLRRFDPVDYDWDTEETVETEVFDDDVRVTVGDVRFTARLRARGYLDAGDGRYHWHGMLYGDQARALKEDGKATAQICIPGGEAVSARMPEITQWGTVRLTGVGTPPWLAVTADSHAS